MKAGLFCLAAAAGVSAGVIERAACTSNKLIDNFSKWADRTNSLEAVSGDDKSFTTSSSSASGLTFNPSARSYLYENFPCQNAVSDNYGSLSFTLQGPAQASLLLEIQTRASCTATTYTSVFRNVTVPTSAQTVTVPLSDFVGANLAAITSFTWSTFNKTGSSYTLGNVNLVCVK